MPERELDLEPGAVIEIDPKGLNQEAVANLIIEVPGGTGEELRLSEADATFIVDQLSKVIH